MLHDLFHNLTGEWRVQLEVAGVFLKPPLSALQISGNWKGEERKTNFLIFSSDENQPALILKLAGSPGNQEKLKVEFRALNEISALGALQGTVPRPLGLFEWENNLIMLEQYLPGCPLTVLLRRHQHVKVKQVQDDLYRVQEWIHCFQTATASTTVLFPGRQAVEERLQALESLKPELSVPLSFRDRLLKTADQYQGLPLPLAGCHGDCWPGNFLLGDKQVAVVDWEAFSKEQLPFQDLFLFVTTYTQAYPWKKWRWLSKAASFPLGFLGASWFSELISECVHRYFQTLQLPRRSAHLFFSLFLLDMAALISPSTGTVPQGQINGWPQVLLLYAENQDSSIFA